MSWLIPSIPGWSKAAAPIPTISTNENDSNELNCDNEDLDVPPQFPLPDSAQRSAAPPKSSSPAFSVVPPSPPRNQEDEEPASELNIAILPDPIPLGNMAPPPSTIKKPEFGIQNGGEDGAKLGEGSKSKKRGKVALTPGHSALDWSRLTSSGKDLRGTGMRPLRITLDELKKHNTKKDAWSALNGRVYNITPYLPFHPGGEEELMRVAGRDGTKLFMLTHSWVNLEYMMQECMVGMLVRG